MPVQQPGPASTGPAPQPEAPGAEPEGSCPATVITALLRCWPVLLVPGFLVLIGAGTEQGRDAIRATASVSALTGFGFHAYAAQCVTTVLTTLAAVILLATWEAERPELRYASHFVAGLVGLLSGYLPLVAFDHYGLSGNGADLWMAISRLVPPAFVIVVRDLLPRLAPRGSGLGDAGLPVFGFGFAVALTFILCDSALLMFGVSAAALAVADIWLCRSLPLAQRRVQQVTLVLVALFAVLGGVLTAFDPAEWGLAMGSYATLIVALNAWFAFSVLLWRLGVRWGRRCGLGPRGLGRLGGMTAALLIYLLLTGPFGLGEVRALDGRAAEAGDVEAHIRAWLAARRTEINAAKTPYPVFLVTADGGGIRAAWWSATLLGLIQDSAPGFSRQILALSGVSGGSLGIATFGAQVAQMADGGASAEHRACAGRGWSQCAEQVLGTDLLAPDLAAMLTVDAPRTILRTSMMADRATAQEKGFEAAWRRVARTDLFAEPFAALWQGERRTRVPLLLLNSTEATTGRRLVMAPVTLGGPDGTRGDVSALLGGRGVRLSTAVLLSARFPGVSPAGWLAATGGGGYALVDGGFSDNSGARSAAEVLAALRRAATAEHLGQRIRPVAIMIANDPLPATPLPEVPGPGRRQSISTVGSLLAPVATLDSLRQANTRRAKRDFADAVCAAGGIVLDGFDVHEGPTAFPLGWMLAQGTRDAMARQRVAMQALPASALSRAVQLAREPSGKGAGTAAWTCRPGGGSG